MVQGREKALGGEDTEARGREPRGRYGAEVEVVGETGERKAEEGYRRRHGCSTECRGGSGDSRLQQNAEGDKRLRTRPTSQSPKGSKPIIYSSKHSWLIKIYTSKQKFRFTLECACILTATENLEIFVYIVGL